MKIKLMLMKIKLIYLAHAKYAPKVSKIKESLRKHKQTHYALSIMFSCSVLSIPMTRILCAQLFIFSTLGLQIISCAKLFEGTNYYFILFLRCMNYYLNAWIIWNANYSKLFQWVNYFFTDASIIWTTGQKTWKNTQIIRALNGLKQFTHLVDSNSLRKIIWGREILNNLSSWCANYSNLGGARNYSRAHSIQIIKGMIRAAQIALKWPEIKSNQIKSIWFDLIW